MVFTGFCCAMGSENQHRQLGLSAVAPIEALEARRLLSYPAGYIAPDGIQLIDQVAGPAATDHIASRAPAAFSASPKRAKRRPKRPAGYSAGPQSSFRKYPAVLPGLIQAEDFDRGGEGAAYHNSSGDTARIYRTADSVDVAKSFDLGGGYMVGNTTRGEWLEYTIDVPAGCFYTFTARVADQGFGGKFHIEIDRVRKTDLLSVPATGGWQNWTDVVVPNVFIPAGRHVLRLAMDSTGFKGVVANFNWMAFTLDSPTAPLGLSATATSAFGVQLNWQSSGWNSSTVLLDRQIGAYGAWAQLGAFTPETASFFDATVDPSTQYFYRLRAANPAGFSDYTDPVVATTPPSDPLFITRGGYYSGSFQSLDPRTAAIVVATNEPVLIANSIIRSRGDIIATQGFAANISIQNVLGISLNPNAYGVQPGRFLDAEGFANIQVANSEMVGTSGIYLYNYFGDHTVNNTVKILRNVANNIDGRMSDGNGGFLGSGKSYVQFFQINGAQKLPGVEIAWNQVINTPGQSLVEDNISIHNSSGTSWSPISIHDNFIQGAYPVDPARDRGFSGGGIMVSDNGSAWVRADNNQVISTTNYGIAISSGHDNSFSGNRIISSGRLPNGQYIAAQNVGAYIWDQDGIGDAFYNNVGRDNLVGWWQKDQRNDWWMPDASKWVGNDNWSGAVNTATEAGEYNYWANKLNRAGVRIGVLW